MIDLKKEFKTRVMFLCVTISVCMSFIFYLKYELDYDRFNAKSDRIYKLVTKLNTLDEKVNTSISSWALAPKIDSNFHWVQQTTRIINSNFRLKSKDSNFITTHGLFAEGSIFEIFDFPLISGTAETALDTPFSVVLTEKAAIQIFGNQNPLGQTLNFQSSKQLFTVTAVAQNLPENSQIKTDLFVSMPTLTKMHDSNNGHEDIGVVTYLLLKAESNKVRIQEEINKLFSGADSRMLSKIITKKQYFLEPLRDKYLNPFLSQFQSFLIYALSVIFLLLLFGSINSVVKIVLLQISLSAEYQTLTVENERIKLVSKVCFAVIIAYVLSHFISVGILCVLMYFFDITFAENLYIYFTITAAILIFSIISGILLSLWVAIKVPAEPIRTYLMIKKDS